MYSFALELHLVVILLFLDKSVQTDAHAQRTANVTVAQVDEPTTAFATFELFNQYRAKLLVDFNIESKSPQVSHLVLHIVSKFTRILILHGWSLLGGVELLRVHVKIGVVRFARCGHCGCEG